MNRTKVYSILGVLGLMTIVVINKNVGLLVFSISFISMLSIMLFRYLKIRRAGQTVIGKILTYQPGLRGHKTPVVEFHTIEGERIIGQPYAYASTDLSIVRSYKSYIDTELEVIYARSVPNRFIIKGQLWLSGFLFAVGIGFGVFACRSAVLRLLD